MDKGQKVELKEAAMRYGSVWSLLAACMALCACSPTHSNARQMIPDVAVSAFVSDNGDGSFTVEYVFAEPHSAWFFSRSETEYRVDAWQALDEGVALERLNGFDAILFDEPVRRARFRLTPQPQLRYEGYSHSIRFSDGSLMLYTGQFEVLPASNREEIESLAGDLSSWTGDQPALGVSITSDLPMIVHGERVRGAALDISTGGGSFVYLGDGAIEMSENYVGLIDPATPDWIRARFPADLAYLIEQLESGWGFALPQPATLLFAFEGHDNPGFSSKGGVLGRQLVIQASGEQLREADDFVHAYLFWFFAHESVHLFQSANDRQLAEREHGWIHEGSANAMANRIMSQRGEAAQAYLHWAFGNAFETCSNALEDGALATAWQRAQSDAYYACGEFVALMTDSALTSHSLYDFWNALLERSEQEDGTYTAQTWFDTARALGMSEADVARLTALISGTLENPREELRLALADFGLDPQFGDNDRLIAIVYPSE
ncbi:MAG: hypothetical protein GYB36_08265 [Alphaproteobacteria bacterium]|nr:hypothetical protein [Alphaproteobacteria bacterium]